MRLRAVLIGSTLAVILVVLFAPWTIVILTGHPLVVECVGPVPEECDDELRDWAEYRPGVEFGEFPWWGPITWVKVRLINGDCGERTIGHWWPFFDPFSITAMPLC